MKARWRVHGSRVSLAGESANRRMRPARSLLISASILIALGSNAAGCSRDQATLAKVAYIYHPHDNREILQHDPIVVIPGFMGSILEDEETGLSVWGRFFGRDGMPRETAQHNELMALPIGDVDLHQLVDEVSPVRILRVAELRVGERSIKVNAYPGVFTSILSGTYDDDLKRRAQMARIARHTEDEDIPILEQVAYDWRRDLSESAAVLHEHLLHAASVARAHREEAGLSTEDVRLDVVAHSTGCLVLRYYLRYGPVPLPEDGSVPEPTWEGTRLIQRAIFVAPPNWGSQSAFASAAFGGRPAAMLPVFPAPVLATLPSLYQLMPPPSRETIVYEDGRPIDLYDPEVWERHGWGLFTPGQEELLAMLLPEVADPQARLDIARKFMARVLRRAEQFHKALGTPAQMPTWTTMHLFASDSVRTPMSHHIEAGSGKVLEVRHGVGDHTVTRASALGDMDAGDSGFSRMESPVSWTSVHWVNGGHMEMIADPVLIDNMLYLLFEQPGPRRRPFPEERAVNAESPALGLVELPWR